MAVGKANQCLKLSSFGMGNQSYLYIDSILGIIYMMVSTDLVVLHGHVSSIRHKYLSKIWHELMPILRHLHDLLTNHSVA